MGILRILHLAVFAFWFGAILYFSFVAAPVLFKNLPRDQFGLVQSRLFPSYYALGYVCGVFLLATFFALRANGPWMPSDTLKVAALTAMLLFACLQGLWAGPRVGAMRLERMEAEKSGDTARAESLKSAFGKAHGLSSLMNLFVVIGGAVYLVAIAKEWKP